MPGPRSPSRVVYRVRGRFTFPRLFASPSVRRERVMGGIGPSPRFGVRARILTIEAVREVPNRGGLMATTFATTDIRPFHIEIPQQKIDDMCRRVTTMRWPTKELVAERSQGV